MLALADRDGVIHCTIPGLADRAKISLEECEYALARFQEPDKYSWSKEDEGRRIRVVSDGWFLINHLKFRSLMSAEETREKTRIRTAKWRDRGKASQTVTAVTSDACDDIVAVAVDSTEPKATAPAHIHPLQFASSLMQVIGLPETTTNARVVAEAIKAEAKFSGRSMEAVCVTLAAKIRDDRDEGIPIDKFYFEDAKWRRERKNGKRADGWLPPQNVAEDYIPESTKRKREQESRKAAGL